MALDQRVERVVELGDRGQRAVQLHVLLPDEKQYKCSGMDDMMNRMDGACNVREKQLLALETEAVPLRRP